jgi:hypothetical protein
LSQPPPPCLRLLFCCALFGLVLGPWLAFVGQSVPAPDFDDEADDEPAASNVLPFRRRA